LMPTAGEGLLALLNRCLHHFDRALSLIKSSRAIWLMGLRCS
jgi:hypothetical protein